MKFNVNLDDKKPENLFPGIAKFKVVHHQEKVSKAGNEMMVLQLEIMDCQLSFSFIYDYFVCTQGWKIKNFLESCKCEDKFNTGNLEESDVLGLTGFCEIGVIEDKNGVYQPKMGIIRYVLEEEGVNLWCESSKENHLAEQKNQQASTVFDDDIPF